MFFPSTFQELDEIRDTCLRLVDKRSVLSGAAAIIPIPGVDITVDIAIMVELLNKINQRFGLTEEQLAQMDSEQRKVLLVIIASVGNELIGKPLTAAMIRNALKQASNQLVKKQAGKFFPIVGQALSASISYMSMHYLGTNHVEQCYEIAKQYISHIDRRNLDDVIDVTIIVEETEERE